VKAAGDFMSKKKVLKDQIGRNFDHISLSNRFAFFFPFGKGRQTSWQRRWYLLKLKIGFRC